MEALFLKLVNMSISASWLVLAVVVLRFAMKKAPKWMTCALWALVAIRLVFPFSIESMFSLIPSREPIPQTVVTNHTPIVTPNTAPVVPIDPAAPIQGIMAGQQASAITPASITELAATVWIVGVAVLLVYALVSYLLIQRKVSASLCLRENIYLCDYIESPFILGIVRPKIYLPSSLDQGQWPHVIAHEKAHLHRRDHWWKPLGFMILCVYWFNPVLWLAYILLCRDIELACDERVIRDMDTAEKKAYSSALLECSMPRYLIAACPLAFGEVGVKERVKSVLNYKKPAFWIILIALILCIAAAVCFLTDPMGSTAVTPGTYNIADTLYQCSGSWTIGMPAPTLSQGTYILQEDSLYFGGNSGIQALGKMWEYDLDNEELRAYLELDPSWQAQLVHVSTITDSMRLDTDTCFYIWFQTSDCKTYLAAGWQNRIAHICRLTRDENAEEMELAWFDADILEARDTWLLVSPIAGSWEAEQYAQIEVSRWWHDTYTDISGQEIAVDGILTGEFMDGDRVRIVYDGKIQETYPARIRNTYSTTRLPTATAVLYNSIEEAILDGCVAMVGGDAVAGQQRWQAFVKQTENGQSASVRLVTYHTLSGPENYDPSDFPEVFKRYPILYIYDLSYDGTQYTLRVTGDGSEHISTWDYLAHFSNVNWGTGTYNDYYVLTNMPDLSWGDYRSSIAVSFTPIRSYPLYSDVLYEDEPTQAELERAKNALEPYMLEYKINYLDANELTHRLDIGVSEWVDGLESLIEQYMDMRFVTVIWQDEGSFVLTQRNDLISRFPEYFGLDTFKGLELYAFEDGYVLMTGTNREKTEAEISALPRANAAEMTQILESYQPGPGSMVDLDDIFIFNRTDRTEREIRKELNILPTANAALYISNATATEGLAEWYLTVHPGCEVWTGYDYHLEVLTDDGWVHYGYPSEELAWPSALRFHYENTGTEPITATEIFDVQWSTTAGSPLPPGRYRYQTGITVYCDGEYSSVGCTGYFDIPEDTPEDPGIHMEILNPTDTGATLAITYNGGLMGELSTQGQYYLMVDVGGGYTTYGTVSSQVPWDDVLYTLKEDQTVYLDVRWDYTADVPLPPGLYCVVLTVNQTVPYQETQQFPLTKYVTEPFAITD